MSGFPMDPGPAKVFDSILNLIISSDPPSREAIVKPLLQKLLLHKVIKPMLEAGEAHTCPELPPPNN